MSATRIYVITDRRTDAQRLVRAANQASRRVGGAEAQRDGGER